MALNDFKVEDLQAALWYLEQTSGNQTEAAKMAGLNRNTFIHRLNRAKELGLSPVAPTVRSAEQENARLKKLVASLQEDADTAERIRKEIYNISSTSPKPPAWLLNIKKGKSSGTPCVLWSDWHWGEVVSKDEIGGVNEFNSEIAKSRVRRLVENTVQLCFEHMTYPTYPGLVLCLGGDMISGDIHEELQDTNDNYTLASLLDLQDVLTWAIEHLADKFGRLFIPCVIGNHGRTTKKPRMKGRAYTSYEWHLYNQLERHFKSDRRVTFYIPTETDAKFQVYNHRFLLTHGDTLGVKGGDGIIGALGPIMRGSIKVSRAESQIGGDFDTILMGHWHQYITLPGIIVNGSLKGYDEFARLALRAPYQPPIQALWFVHPKYGITAQWPIYLDSHRKAVQPVDWIAVPSQLK